MMTRRLEAKDYRGALIAMAAIFGILLACITVKTPLDQILRPLPLTAMILVSIAAGIADLIIRFR